jgi:hypothetical protein
MFFNWLKDFNPFNYVVEFVKDYNNLTSDNHDQVGFGGNGLGWRRRDFSWVCHRS